MKKIKVKFFWQGFSDLFLMDSKKNPKKKNYENVKAEKYYL